MPLLTHLSSGTPRSWRNSRPSISQAACEINAHLPGYSLRLTNGIKPPATYHKLILNGMSTKKWCAWQGSNPRTWNRNPVLYPLSYRRTFKRKRYRAGTRQMNEQSLLYIETDRAASTRTDHYLSSLCTPTYYSSSSNGTKLIGLDKSTCPARLGIVSPPTRICTARTPPTSITVRAIASTTADSTGLPTL